ncbi:hypothetical protein M8818_007177 [Zalaria obscura]|uniref:Uncharacterized protein n=1 Tax=Zalaria obscura TaxID=2024903 RepID=A0ACC3S4U8_9PEZI
MEAQSSIIPVELDGHCGLHGNTAPNSRPCISPGPHGYGRYWASGEHWSGPSGVCHSTPETTQVPPPNMWPSVNDTLLPEEIERSLPRTPHRPLTIGATDRWRPSLLRRTKVPKLGGRTQSYRKGLRKPAVPARHPADRSSRLR